MTPLRQRMIDAMQLRGLATRTQQAYVGAVVGLAKHYGCSPEQLDGPKVDPAGPPARAARDLKSHQPPFAAPPPAAGG